MNENSISLRYEYKIINDIYILDKLIITNNSLFKIDKFKDIVIRKDNRNLYKVSISKVIQNIKSIEYWIPESYLKVATLNDILNFSKPIILNYNSNSELIIKDSEYDYSFIKNIDGKIINMWFESDKILVYFPKTESIYAIKRNIDKMSALNVFDFNSFQEKHMIVKDDGIFSDFLCNDEKEKRSQTFCPLVEGKYSYKIIESKKYNYTNKFNIAPQYIYNSYNTTIFYKRYNNEDPILNTHDLLLSNEPIDIFDYDAHFLLEKRNIYSDLFIPELSFKGNEFEIEWVQFFPNNLNINIVVNINQSIAQ